MNLHTAGHHRGVVCAPHAAAAEAGRAVLADGGNAIEAMVAMAATIAVVYPHMNSIGGDGFWLVREPSGKIRALMAAGPAGSLARPALYREAGHDVIPTRGPLAALTVPAAIGGWALALDVAKALGARMPLGALLADAIRHAREGVAVAGGLAAQIAASVAELRQVPGFAETYLIDGKPPAASASLKFPALAATLDHLAQAGLDDFYRGDVGREIAADLDRLGSPVVRADLERCRALLAEPLAVTVRSGTVRNTPPPTHGLVALIILALFDRFAVTYGVNEPGSFEHLHGLVEATKLALAIRDRSITDPGRLPYPPQRFLDGAFLNSQAEKIDPRKAASGPVSRREGDTVWMGAADASGLVVSYIQSIYWEFGSGVVLPRTGVLMQNRGTAFTLEPRLNILEPGRVPPHTLNPALAVLDDGRVMAYGAMGGDAQPQFQSQVFTRHVLYRQPLETALDAPRWLYGRTWGASHGSLILEGRFDGNLIDRLLGAGHDVVPLAEPYTSAMGHAGAVVLHPDGTLEGGHDPRADGGAAGV
jgi:gamma-glutamyltranspeptidase/glutathione hydrolase